LQLRCGSSLEANMCFELYPYEEHEAEYELPDIDEEELED